MAIKKGDKVKVDYEGRLEDGTVFDSSQHGDHSHPLEFEVGSGQVIKGFDEAVVGMKKGGEKEITIEPKDAYGEVKEGLEQKIPRRKTLPNEKEPEEGMILVLRTQEGRQIPVKIKKVEKDSITIDLNHPLAGKRLMFKIKITGVNN